VYIFNLGPDGTVAVGDDALTCHFDTAALGLSDPSGIEYNPERKTLFIISTFGGDFNLMETTKAGNAVYRYDLYGLGNMRRSGLALAPNSQNPTKTSLYMTNRGLDNDDNPRENDGQVYELLLGQPHPEPTPTPGAQSESLYLPVIRGD
jgi:hypothetical protein